MSFYISLQNAVQRALDKLKGKQWRQRQIRKISDRIFDLFKNESGKATLTPTDLYIAVLLVHNDMNKFLPGPHINPPSREKVMKMMQTCDINFDGEIDHDEFEKFIQLLTVDTVAHVSKGLIIALIVAPAVAVVTKRATEGVPGFGKVVQRLPDSIFALLVTLAIALFHKLNPLE